MAKRGSRKSSRKASRKNRKASRRASRSSRSSRRSSCGTGRCWSRRASRSSRQSGGMAPLNDTSMAGAGKVSLEQGNEYLRNHNGQHGGGVASYVQRQMQRGGGSMSLVNSAPVGYTGMLDDSLRGAARITPLDQALGATAGMSDRAVAAPAQSGGRRKGSRKGRKASKKGRKGSKKASRKGSKKASRKGRKGSRRGRSLQNRMTKGVRNSMTKMRRMMKLMRRRLMRGGAYSLANAADYGAPGMLLSPGDEAKALGGMNPEWKLATDPGSFAPK